VPEHVIIGKPYPVTLRKGEVNQTVGVTWSIAPEANVELSTETKEIKTLELIKIGEHILKAKIGGIVVDEISVFGYRDHDKTRLFNVDGNAIEVLAEGNLLAVGKRTAFKIRNTDDNSTRITDPIPPKFSLEPPDGIEVFASKDATSPLEVVDNKVQITYGQPFYLTSTKAGSGLQLKITSQAVKPGGIPAAERTYSFKAVATPDAVELDKSTVSIRTGMTTQVTASAKYKKEAAEGVTFHWEITQKDVAEIVAGTEKTATVSVTGKKAGTTELKLIVTPEVGEPLPATAKVEVKPAFAKAVLEGETSMQKGDRVKFNLRLLNELDAQENLQAKQVDVKIAAESGADKVKIRRAENTPDPFAFTAEGLAVGESEVRFEITVTGETAKAISVTAVFKVVEVTDFVPLEVSLQHLDDQTVMNTFGSAISRDYHVMMVNMVNKLRALDNGTKVDGILVYGQSFEVGIDLLKQSGKTWTAVTFEEVTRAFTRAYTNEENPMPVGVVSQPVGSIVIDKQKDRVDARQNSFIHLRLNESAKLGVAHLDGASISATSENSAIVGVEGGDTIVANAVGETAIKVTITIQVKDEGKTTTRPACATIKALVRVLPTSGTMLKMERPSTIGTVEQIKRVSVSTRADYVLSMDYPVSDYTVTMDRSVSFNPETGVVRALSPIDTLITAVKKSDPDKGHVLYLGVNFVAADQAQLLPPSVFEDESGLRHVKAMLRYRPVAQELILLSQDQREVRSNEGFFRNVLGFAVQIFGWAYARKPDWAGNNDLVPGILALGPEFVSRFYPDRTQVNRNAILTQGMRATETIPFGGQLQRVVFFPKKELRGYIPNEVVKIGAIDSSRFRISVGAITTLRPATEKNTIPTGTGGGGGKR
jgi:hypothetical protein